MQRAAQVTLKMGEARAGSRPEQALTYPITAPNEPFDATNISANQITDAKKALLYLVNSERELVIEASHDESYAFDRYKLRQVDLADFEWLHFDEDVKGQSNNDEPTREDTMVHILVEYAVAHALGFSPDYANDAGKDGGWDLGHKMGIDAEGRNRQKRGARGRPKYEEEITMDDRNMQSRDETHLYLFYQGCEYYKIRRLRTGRNLNVFNSYPVPVQ